MTIFFYAILSEQLMRLETWTAYWLHSQQHPTLPNIHHTLNKQWPVNKTSARQLTCKGIWPYRLISVASGKERDYLLNKVAKQRLSNNNSNYASALKYQARVRDKQAKINWHTEQFRTEVIQMTSTSQRPFRGKFAWNLSPFTIFLPS